MRASPLTDTDRDLARLRECLQAAIALLDRLDAPAEGREPDADWEPWCAPGKAKNRARMFCGQLPD